MIHETSIKTMKVSEAMTHNPIVVNQDTSLTEVQTIFDTEMIHHIPVIDDSGFLMGIISKSDLNLLLDWGTRLNLRSSQVKNEKLLSSNNADSICSPHVMAVRPEDSLMYCFEIFRENYFRSLPVVDDEGKIVGIITPYDLMVAAFTK
ncbi:MAG TPA: CBS domain-containing protein [Saprospiraceae bacterium]|nr:CBS domain-containing protein [Saprospiraceae bacterium]HRG65081.1 CBS domain-containing protein [Saprospiraceae bacterium]